jgi:hypothetical protein
MKTHNFIFLCVVAPIITGILGALVAYNLTPEKTPHHTSTVSGTSGELKCTTSCVIKEQ